MSNGFSEFDLWFGQAEATARRIGAENAREGVDDAPARSAHDGWNPETSPLPRWSPTEMTISKGKRTKT